MASVCSLRTSGLFLLLFLFRNAASAPPPWILSVRINALSCDEVKCDYNLTVSGLGVNKWSLTLEPAARGAECYATVLGSSESTSAVLELQNGAERRYFCAESDGVWLHQGDSLYLEPANDVSGRTLFAV